MHAVIGWNSGLYQRAGFQIFAWEFWQNWPKLNISCEWGKRDVNELFVSSEYDSRKPLLTTVV